MKTTLLGDVCEVNPRTDADLQATQTCSFIPMEYVDERFGTISRQDTRTVGDVMNGHTFFKNGDVLFAKITPCMENGKAAIAQGLVNGIGFGSTEFHVVRPSKAVIPELVFYFLRQDRVRKYAERRMTGSAGQQRVSSIVLEEFELPLPTSLKEQKRIAAILKKADRLRRVRRHARQLSDTFLQSVFIDMFGNPVSNERGWDTELLRNVCRPKEGIKAGPFGSSLKKEFYSESGVRIYGQEQVIAGDFSVGNYYISLEMFRDFRAYEVKPGDLLFSLVGSFGKVLIVTQGIEPGIINPRLLKISPLPNRADSTFLAQLIQDRIVQAKLSQMSHGGTMGILNAGLLKRLRVVIPPLPIQQQFAAIARRFERLCAQQREAERQAEHLFQTLLHRAFAGGVVGVAKSRSVRRKPSVPAKKRIYSPGIFYRRAAIEAYVINALRGDKYLGRTKLEKIDHLIEYHCGIDLERYPVRDAAGPDDYLSRMKLEHLANKRNWFSAHDKKDGSIVRYLPKRGFMSAAHKGAQEIGEKRNSVDNLLALMRPLDTKRCEIIATLYAAWNDFLLTGKSPSDAEIAHDAVNNWRPEKQLIPERRWLRGLKWMRENGLVPTGCGKPVVHSDSK